MKKPVKESQATVFAIIHFGLTNPKENGCKTIENGSR